MVAEVTASSKTSFKLKKEWDYRPHLYVKPNDLHVIRKESDSLLDFVYRKNEGSMLLSGHRGRGKTSLVFSTINRMMQYELENNDFETVAVAVNAPDFELTKDTIDIRRPILQTLVRRLYQACLDKGIANEMEVTPLYDRAIATKMTTERSQNNSEKSTAKLETESEIKMDITKQISTVAISAVVALILFLRQDIPYNYLFSIVSLVTPTAVLSFLWTRKKSKILEKDKKNTSSLYYLYDYDTATLQSEFERVLRILTDPTYRNFIFENLGKKNENQKKYRVIFVIDELDKVSAEVVLRSILAIKMLINQSLCLFIFVSDTTFYDYVTGRSMPSEGEYTLFSQRMFLGRPSFEEMKRYIHNIIDQFPSNSTVSKKDYDIFLNFSCFESRTDFFEMNMLLRDFISDYDNDGFPWLRIDLSTPSRVTKSNLQKAVEYIYNENMHIHSSYKRKDDMLLDRLYQLAWKICEQEEGTKIRIDYSSKMGIEFVDGKSLLQDAYERKIDSISIEDETEKKASIDFLRLLSLPLPKANTYLRQIGSVGQPEQYEIGDRLAALPSLRVHMPNEVSYITAYKDLFNILVTYANLLNRYGDRFISQVLDQESLEAQPEFLLEKLNPILTQPLSSLTDCIDNYRNLVIESSERVNTELKQPIETLVRIKTQVLNNFSLLIEKILGSRDLRVTLKRTSNLDIFRNFGIEILPADEVMLANSNSLVISRSNFAGVEESLIIMNNQRIEDLNKLDRAIKDSSRTGIYMTYFDESDSIEEVLTQNKKIIGSLLLIKYPTDIQISPLSKIYAINLISNFELLRNIVLSILFWCYGNPSSPDTIRRSARDLVDAGLYEEAVSSLRGLLDIDPYDVGALVDLGYIQYTQRDNPGSIESNERALEVDNTQLEAWYNRALAYENLGRFEEALASYNEAISLNPLEETYWFGRARCQRLLRRYLEAHKSINYVLTINPENYKARAEKARTFWEQRDDMQAIATMRSAISLNPLELVYYKDLVYYLNNKALYWEAKKVLDEMPGELQKDQDLIDLEKSIMFKLKGSPISKNTKNSSSSKRSKNRKQEAGS